MKLSKREAWLVTHGLLDLRAHFLRCGYRQEDVDTINGILEKLGKTPIPPLSP